MRLRVHAPPGHGEQPHWGQLAEEAHAKGLKSGENLATTVEESPQAHPRSLVSDDTLLLPVWSHPRKGYIQWVFHLGWQEG